MFRRRRMSPVFPGPVLELLPPIERSPTQADQSGRDQVRPSTGSFFQAAEHRGRFRFGIILAAARLLGWNGQRHAADPLPSRLTRGLRRAKRVATPANSALEPTAHLEESRNALRLSASRYAANPSWTLNLRR
jgi:hypothetical protein